MALKEKVIFLPGLNGIRTFAACGVMGSHITLALQRFNFNYSLFGFKNGKVDSWVLGEHGVTMFFVLSGFLITYLLFQERKKMDRIAVKSFYIRRALRIWPLYYLYFLVALVVLAFDVGVHLDWIPLSYVFFLANIPFILQVALPNLDHFWSIAVEEQFYLLWPWFFRMEEKKLIWLMVLVIFGLSILRIVLWYYMPFSVPALISVVNRFDCMMFGALGASLFIKNNRVFMNIMTKNWVQWLATLILFSLLLNVFWFLNSIIEIFVVEAMTLVLIMGQIVPSVKVLNFNNRIMDYLGKLSYGIYVIHILVIHFVLKITNWQGFHNQILAISLIYLLVVGITIILAHLSYNYYEKPFLKLKNKFAVVQSSATKTFDTATDSTL